MINIYGINIIPDLQESIQTGDEYCKLSLKFKLGPNLYWVRGLNKFSRLWNGGRSCAAVSFQYIQV